MFYHSSDKTVSDENEWPLLKDLIISVAQNLHELTWSQKMVSTHHEYTIVMTGPLCGLVNELMQVDKYVDGK